MNTNRPKHTIRRFKEGKKLNEQPGYYPSNPYNPSGRLQFQWVFDGYDWKLTEVWIDKKKGEMK